MKKYYLQLISLMAALLFLSCPFSNDIRLIIRGDDMGFCHEANVGCITSYQEGIMTVVEVMVPCPAFKEAAKMLRENPGLDVGIHLTMTSEWSNLKWGSLTHAPSLVDSSGHFFQEVWTYGELETSQVFSEADWKLEEVERELRAQIDTALAYIPHCSHLSSHMAFHQASPLIMHLILNLAKEYKLTSNLSWWPIKEIDLFGDNWTAEEKIEHAVGVLENLEPGRYIFVEHPGIDTPAMRAIDDYMGVDTAISRDAVTKAFTSEKINEVIKKRGIKLVRYGE